MDQQRLSQSAVRCRSISAFISFSASISAFTALELGSSAAMKALMEAEVALIINKNSNYNKKYNNNSIITEQRDQQQQRAPARLQDRCPAQ